MRLLKCLFHFHVCIMHVCARMLECVGTCLWVTGVWRPKVDAEIFLPIDLLPYSLGQGPQSNLELSGLPSQLALGIPPLPFNTRIAGGPR